MSTPLLRTKLYIPPIRSEILSRPKLLHRIDSSIGKKLTLISAPAGFGKTTLLGDWIATRNSKVAWISLDGEDNDTSRFLAYILAALRTIDPHLGDCVSETLESSQPPSLQSIVGNLINDIVDFSQCFSMVFDDYHVITNPKIHEAMVFLLDNLPLNLHLFIISRADPPWPLARLRARQSMIELRAQDLRLTSTETAAFLNGTMGLGLSEGDVDELDTRTEGWVVGLQMAALSMQGREKPGAFIQAFSGSHRFILDYLIEEVLDQQASNIQDFLLRTSILNRLSAPLCEAVVQANSGQAEASALLQFSDSSIYPSLEHANPEDSEPPHIRLSTQATLAFLDQANLFVIPLDDERTWYRYHHLFADLLKNRLTQIKPSLIPHLHLAASRWYGEAGYPDEAINHAIAAGDQLRAAELIERHGIEAVYTNKEITLSNWLAALPTKIIQTRPWLCYFQAYVYHWTGERDKIEEMLQYGEKAMAAITAGAATKPQLTEPDRTRMPGYIAALRAHTALTCGDIDQVVVEAEKATKLLKEGDFMHLSASVALGGAYWAQGDVKASEQAFYQGSESRNYPDYQLVGGAATTYYAQQLIKQGRLQEAHDVLQSANNRYRLPSGRMAPISGFIGIKLGDILREWNKLEDAAKFILPGVGRCERLGQADVLGEAFVSLVRYQLAIQDISGAINSLQKGFDLIRTSQVDPWICTWLDTCQIRIWLLDGDLNSAERWMADSRLGITDEMNYHQDLPLINLARVLVAQGVNNPGGPFLDQSIVLLSRLQAAARSAGWIHELISIQILTAQAYLRKNELEAATDCFEQALTLAKPGGYLRVFVDEGKPVEKLLSLTNRQSKSKEYAHALTAVIKAARHQNAIETGTLAGSVLIEPLSTRELEVLQYLPTSLTVPEIAQELYISTSTVRSHIKNIYGKLAVGRRMDAVERARELALIK